MADSLLISWVRWHYTRGVSGLIRIARTFLEFSFHLFSVEELLQTFFAPWHGIIWRVQGKAWFSGTTFEAFIGNIISRILGALMRSMLIAAGIVVTGALSFVAILTVLAWLSAPFLAMWLFIFGLQILL